MNKLKEQLIPILIALVIFIALSMIFLSPALEGKSLRQGDIVQFKGMSKEIVDYREKTGKESLWTNSMFGGMPAYLISVKYSGNKIKQLQRIILLNGWMPFAYIFLYLLGFYIALLAFGVNKWLSIIGAVAYAFSSYLIIIIDAGHLSKVEALGYMPPIIAGVYLAFRGKYFMGGLLSGLFLSLQLLIMHTQITYYTFLVILIYGISEFIYAFKNKELLTYFKAIGTLSAFVALVALTNFSVLWTTYEYSKFSNRGESEIAVANEIKTSGLDKDYATQWSIGKAETFTLLIPNFKGGSSSEQFAKDGEVIEYLQKNQNVAQIMQKNNIWPSRYWGDQPHTSPVYAGAIIVFLFVLGLFLVEGRMKWWILSATVLSILLSWGSNSFAQFNLSNFFLDHFPGYNKFRAVSMILIIAELTLPLLAMLALHKIFTGEFKKEKVKQALLISTSIVGGLCFLFILFAGAFKYTGLGDQNLQNNFFDGLNNAVRAERKALLISDAFRSLFFILASASVILLFVYKKLKANYAILIIGLLVLLDFWKVDRRYLSNDNFLSKKEQKEVFKKNPVDDFIAQEPSQNYRVLNLTVNTFNDATTSYFHKSIGGYHGAKIRRYQDLIEHKIYPEMSSLIGILRSQTTYEKIDSAMANCNVLNLLNTKFFIIDPQSAPLPNAHALGNAWFVKSFVLVKDPNEELKLTGTVSPTEKAFIDQRFSALVEQKKFVADSLASIKLTDYQPNHLTYASTAGSEQLALFSEIYYPAGWIATIDGQPVEILRANYIQRAIVVPAGEHKIEFVFHPKSYFMGEKVSLASSMLMILLILGTLGIKAYKVYKKE